MLEEYISENKNRENYILKSHFKMGKLRLRVIKQQVFNNTVNTRLKEW